MVARRRAASRPGGEPNCPAYSRVNWGGIHIRPNKPLGYLHGSRSRAGDGPAVAGSVFGIAAAHSSRRLEVAVEGCQAHAGRVSHMLNTQRLIEMSADPGEGAPDLQKTTI